MFEEIDINTTFDYILFINILLLHIKQLGKVAAFS